MRTRRLQVRQFVVFLFASFLLFTASSRADSFTVESWRLLAYVSDTTTGETLYHRFTTVQNPFADQHSVSLPSDPATTTAAQYDISWLADYGTFNIASQQQARGLSWDTVQTVASGNIRLAVTEPLQLHIDSFWSYELPADWMMTHMDVNVRAADSSDFLFIQEYQVQTIPGGPASGTRTIHGDVTLTPGHTWIMSYSLRLEADAGPNFSATGNGYVNFTIAPEASTLALLASLVLAIPRRAARHQRTPSP